MMLFSRIVYRELEPRVGTTLSVGLSDAQLRKFEPLIDRDLESDTAWPGPSPAFLDDPLYATMAQNLSPATPDVAV